MRKFIQLLKKGFAAVRRFLKTRSGLTKKTCFVFALLVLLTSCIFIIKSSLSDIKFNALQHLQKADKIRRDVISKDSLLMDSNFSTKLAFLRSRFDQIQKRKEHHQYLGNIYYINYFLFNVIIITSSILMVVLIFLIAFKGWADTRNEYFKIAFLFFFIVSSFFGVLTLVFNQKENYQNNYKQYISYDNLQTNIMTYLNRSQFTDSVSIRRNANDFIVKVDSLMQQNMQLFIETDGEKFSIDKISESLGRISNGGKIKQ